MDLIKGIGLQNFKSFTSYQFCEFNSISLLIGKNAAGKSSFLQAAQLIFKFLSTPDSYRYFPVDNSKMIKNNKIVSEENFQENFTHIHQFINDPSKPLIIDLVSSLEFENGHFRTSVLKYRFSFSVLNIDGEDYLILQSMQLYDYESKELLLTNTFRNHLETYNIELRKEGLNFLLDAFFFYIGMPDVKDPKAAINRVLDREGLNDKKNKRYEKFETLKPQLLYEVEELKILASPIQRFDESHGFDSGAILTEINIFNDEISSYLGSCSEELMEALDISYQALKECFLQLSSTLNSVVAIKISEIGFPQRTVEQKAGFLNAFQEGEINGAFVQSNLMRFEFSDWLIAQRISPDKKEYRIILPNKEGKEVNLRDSGSGYWILTYLIFSLGKSSNEGKIILIEEPETFLHPGFQAKLADLFIEAVGHFNCQLIIETHSEYVVKRLQRRIAESNNKNVSNPSSFADGCDLHPCSIDNKQIAINYIVNENEERNVLQIGINEDGDLERAFPRDFTDVSINEDLLLFKMKNPN